jgi:hypothetical protein
LLKVRPDIPANVRLFAADLASSADSQGLTRLGHKIRNLFLPTHCFRDQGSHYGDIVAGVKNPVLRSITSNAVGSAEWAGNQPLGEPLQIAAQIFVL